MNKRQLAKTLGVSLSTVDKWLLKPDFPARKVGKQYQFNLEEVQAWLEQRDKKRDKGVNLSRERAKLVRINARIKELQLKKMQGELIDRQEAFNVFAFVLTRMAEKIKAIPVKASALLISAKSMQEIKQILEELITEVLNEISSEQFVYDSVCDYASMHGYKQ